MWLTNPLSNNVGIFGTKEELEVVKANPLTLHDTVDEALSCDMIVLKCYDIPKNRNIEE